MIVLKYFVSEKIISTRNGGGGTHFDRSLTLLGAGGTGGLVLVRGGGKNTPPQNLKISGSEAQHV